MKKLLFGALAVILAFYFLFAIGLTVLEWIVRDNPRVEESLQAHSTAPHTLTHFDQGAASFHRRLELVQSAKQSIELEFFIYDVDEASRLLTQALMKKAREGVQVRILVDFSAPVFKLKPAYARVLGEAGVKVRYYNTSAVFRLVSIQHRSHRKLLIIDGTTVLTGGRNVANDYFDLSDHYNFLDSDLEVSGPIVKTVLASFDVYWNSHLSTEPEPLLGTYNMDPRSANLNSELMLVCRGQRELAAEVLASIAAREAASGKVIERGNIVNRSALLGESPLKQRFRFLIEIPVANLFDFLL